MYFNEFAFNVNITNFYFTDFFVNNNLYLTTSSSFRTIGKEYQYDAHLKKTLTKYIKNMTKEKEKEYLKKK